MYFRFSLKVYHFGTIAGLQVTLAALVLALDHREIAVSASMQHYSVGAVVLNISVSSNSVATRTVHSYIDHGVLNELTVSNSLVLVVIGRSNLMR
uniref:Uncharacterized protein n=1 Tax=Cucumis melo TaxID=3656 RepID=A0A9I9EAT0_CUCME